MRKNTCFCIVLLIALFNFIQSKEMKKSSSKRPNKTSPQLYCNSCQAMVRQALKELKHRKSEVEVMSTMDSICDPKKYNIYEYPPPDMRQGCEAFVADWEQTVQKALIGRTLDNQQIEERICYDLTDACINVNVKDAPRFDDHIMVDGQPVPIQKNSQEDGGGATINLNEDDDKSGKNSDL